MASTTAFLAVFLFAPFLLTSAQTKISWTLGPSYTSYSTQSFKSGGTIEFDYNSNQHNVLEVSKSDYTNCVTNNPINTHSDGKTKITLGSSTMYFICGFPTHCQNGMKLQINVGSGSSTPATPATPSTPSSTPAPSDSTTPSTTTASPPKDSNTAAGLSTAGRFMFGVPLVLGAMFAFMS